MKDEGDDRKRDVQMDWYLELRSRARGGPFIQRRAVIRCQMEKQAKHWKITSMKPSGFFDASKH
ncbi:MAG: hypothetical protein M3Y27_15785 [Acidobacteriota bacterium]|nr:hypothetical protein [Acidobacteriota bacterium]